MGILKNWSNSVKIENLRPSMMKSRLINSNYAQVKLMVSKVEEVKCQIFKKFRTLKSLDFQQTKQEHFSITIVFNHTTLMAYIIINRTVPSPEVTKSYFTIGFWLMDFC